MDKPKVKLGKHRSHVIYRTKDGKRVPGSSTIAKIGEDSGGLVHAAWKLGTEGIDYKSEWSKAGEAGTVAHFLISCHLLNQEPDLSEFSPEVIDLAENVFLKFLSYWDDEGFTLYVSDRGPHSEIGYVSELGYGGTLDIVARHRDGALTLIDEKSSKDIFMSHLCQLASYEYLFNENNEEKIAKRAIFRNGKKEKKDTELRWLDDMSDYYAHFLNQLRAYQSAKKLKS